MATQTQEQYEKAGYMDMFTKNERRPAHRPLKRRVIVDPLTQDYYNVLEVADLLKLDKTTVYKMVHNGEIPAIKTGRAYQISKADLARLFCR